MTVISTLQSGVFEHEMYVCGEQKYLSNVDFFVESIDVHVAYTCFDAIYGNVYSVPPDLIHAT